MSRFIMEKQGFIYRMGMSDKDMSARWKSTEHRRVSADNWVIWTLQMREGVRNEGALAHSPLGDCVRQ